MFSLIKKWALFIGFVTVSILGTQVASADEQASPVGVQVAPADVQAPSQTASQATTQVLSIDAYKVKLQGIAQDLVVTQHIYNPKMIAFSQNAASLKEEDLIDMCDQMLIYQNDLGDRVADVIGVKEALIQYLKGFVASGMALTYNPNLAFVRNTQNLDFTVKFVNSDGAVRTRKYALKILSFGLKIELALKVDGIMIVGSDFNYYDSAGKEYDLGGGIDIGWFPGGKTWDMWSDAKHSILKHADGLKSVPLLGRYFEERKESHYLGICLTISKIQETSSYLVIGGIAFGWGGSVVISGVEASYVFGGKMTPIKD